MGRTRRVSMGFSKKGEALKADFLTRVDLIRDFILCELNEAPKSRKDVYERLEEYDPCLSLSLSFIDFCASEKKEEWHIRCNRARERVYKGIIERQIGGEIYLDLASRAREV